MKMDILGCKYLTMKIEAWLVLVNWITRKLYRYSFDVLPLSGSMTVPRRSVLSGNCMSTANNFHRHQSCKCDPITRFNPYPGTKLN